MTFKCLSPECGRTFVFAGRKSVERKPPPSGAFVVDVVRIVIDSPCCPYCGSIEFQVIEENKSEPNSNGEKK